MTITDTISFKTSHLSDVGLAQLTVVAAALLVVYAAVRYKDSAVGARAPVPRFTSDLSQKWPKGPKGHFLLGNQPEMAANAHRYLDLFMEWREKYGLGYEITLPGRRVVEVNHPAWLEHFQKKAFNKYGKQHLLATNGTLQRTGIFMSDGHAWMVQRKAAVQSFSRSHFKSPISDKIGAQVDTLIGLLDNLAKSGEVFDFQDVMARFTMLVSTSIAFSSTKGISDIFTSDPKCLSVQHEFIEGFDNASPAADARTRNTLWPIYELFDKRPKVAIDTAVDKIYNYIEPAVKERLQQIAEGTYEKDVKGTGDLLDLAITQETDVWVLAGWMVNLLFAGRDTTAYSLSWQMHEMLQNQNRGGDLFRRAREEIAANQDAVGFDASEEENFHLDYDNMKDYRVLNAIWQETIRLHPASARGMATCYEDDILPAIPHLNQPAVPVKKGDLVMWQDWVMNRLESIWPEPLKFDADRFLDRNDGSLIQPSTWILHSFNGGPRTCVGKTLATFDALSVMTAILPLFEFECTETDYEPKYTTGMNMGIAEISSGPNKGKSLPLRVKRRGKTA
ncbi:unnamed protein product [Sympodiomycopsis kandeliae]